jgi:hypothetical protein
MLHLERVGRRSLIGFAVAVAAVLAWHWFSK